ncbi:hypothetical protein BGZ61DRAFT_20578 [Ilyonectria robusta]|uniref:uncharacterized protein n=1 Tax=Ilyonectria robusta TaxID=1079257 RepID=UPI001E8E6946|nr:uncharacterized protein BGZ61DRAFT_20578 [Ilyonectria robusta]KAH8737686.1 hypothetical protein BGZ61DRAFT_20578 [Ilyonectria robusta]
MGTNQTPCHIPGNMTCLPAGTDRIEEGHWCEKVSERRRSNHPAGNGGCTLVVSAIRVLRSGDAAVGLCINMLSSITRVSLRRSAEHTFTELDMLLMCSSCLMFEYLSFSFGRVVVEPPSSLPIRPMGPQLSYSQQTILPSYHIYPIKAVSDSTTHPVVVDPDTLTFIPSQSCANALSRSPVPVPSNPCSQKVMLQTILSEDPSAQLHFAGVAIFPVATCPDLSRRSPFP